MPGERPRVSDDVANVIACTVDDCDFREEFETHEAAFRRHNETYVECPGCGGAMKAIPELSKYQVYGDDWRTEAPTATYRVDAGP